MNYCTKCGKFINPGEEGNHGLCFHCYQKYLYEKIEHLGEKRPESKSVLKDIRSFIKELFHK